MKKIVIALIATGIAVAILSSYISYEMVGEKIERREGRKPMMARYAIYNLILVLNIFLLISLLIIYLDTYLKTKSSFMLGLVFFIGTLLIHSILSLPLVGALFGFPPLFSLPYIFELLALVILLILSME